MPCYLAHHLIPDEVARTHPLALAARARGAPPWDLDNPDNGIALPGSPEKVGTTGLPVHRGSHANYTEHARDALREAEKALVKEYGSVDRVPPEVLVQTMKTVEKKLRHDILTEPDLLSPMGRLK